MPIRESFIIKLLRAHNTSTSTFYGRRNRRWSLLKSITESPNHRRPEGNKLLIDCNYEKKMKLNLSAINDFLYPDIGQGGDEDFNDTDKRIKALKRSFTMLYKPKK